MYRVIGWDRKGNFETARAVAIYMLGRDIRKYAIFKNEFLFPDLTKYPESSKLEKALEAFEVPDE